MAALDVSTARTGSSIRQELLVDRASGDVLLAWRLLRSARAAQLHVRPLAVRARLSRADARERPLSILQRAPTAATSRGDRTRRCRPIAALTNGTYAHEPLWYRNFLYREEAARGLDCIEDLASPGTFTFDLRERDAIIVLRAAIGIGDDAQTLGNAHPRRRVGAPRASFGARPRRRRVRRAPRQRPDDHRRLSMVHRLGPRHVHRDARASSSRAAGYDVAASILLALGGARIRRHAAQSLSRSRRERRNSTRSTLRSGIVIAVHDFLAAAQPDSAVRARLQDAVASDPRRLRRGNAIRHPRGRRWSPRVRRSGRPAHLDGREGRRPRRDAANRQAGRGAGAVDQRARGARAGATMRWRARAETAFRERFWNPASGCLLRRRRRRSSKPDASTPAFVRIRSSRSADCRSQSWTPMSRARSSRPSSASC